MKMKGLLGVFEYLDDLVKALEVMREKNYEIKAVYSPVRSRQIIQALGLKPSPVRYFTLIGAISGIALGFGLAVYTALQWKFIVSGKPPVPRVPYVIVAFEFCILFGVLWNLASLWLNSRLPKLRLPEHYDPRFSGNRFGVVVTCTPSAQEQVVAILNESGAEEVHEAGE
ncbi:DUF3341 domain-containing protein [Desulfoferrobacter suflitae]|uniref:DUF3341 domain-containing protein n=1 Tax=Desulfoferrobacter suflitae TaxID=2865782 RepID=UPI00216462CE|nr:DUF3341 domain-containing protein [Desulfoferrobacter suflitae]MCK8602180.1 DUF3341 domain-containing protein [Desulfoferrobacter suflitae]